MSPAFLSRGGTAVLLGSGNVLDPARTTNDKAFPLLQGQCPCRHPTSPLLPWPAGRGRRAHTGGEPGSWEKGVSWPRTPKSMRMVGWEKLRGRCRALSPAASCSASLPEGPEQSRSSSTRLPFWKASDASKLPSQPLRFPRDVFHNFPFYPCKAQPDVLSRRRRKSMLEQKCL